MTLPPAARRRACVIGWPVAHSRSPIIHNFWLEQHRIDGSYEKVAVAPDKFTTFIRHLAGNGFVGANVTLPHKEGAFAACAKTTETASRLRAVNTLWIEDGELSGDNTDGEGFLGAMDRDAPGWDTGRGTAVVLGAGGAARALVSSLRERGLARILVLNRTRSRAEELAAWAGEGVEVGDWDEPAESLEGAILVANATSLGMTGQPPLDIDLSLLSPRAVVFDSVYVPLETGLLRQADAMGLRKVSGIGMLLHQAVPGFRRWFGITPSVTVELRGLVEADIRAST